MTKTGSYKIQEMPKKWELKITFTCDKWDTHYISDNVEQQFYHSLWSFNKKWQGTALAMFRMILRIWRRKNLSIFAQKSETWSNLESLPELLVGYKCYGFYPTLSVWFTTLLWPILNKWDKFWQAGVCSWSHMLYFFGYQKHLMAKLCPFFIHPTSKREKDITNFETFLLSFEAFWMVVVIQYTI